MDAWLYKQSTGELFDPTGAIVGQGYSGLGKGLNNPALEFTPNVGPISAGTYANGAPKNPVDHLGPQAMPLVAYLGKRMGGRFVYFLN